MIFGIMGYKGSGKDTVADYLIDRHSYTKVAFSDPLKEMALKMDPLVAFERGEAVRLSEAVKRHGWDVVKRRYLEARRTLQVLGTEIIRENVTENFWVDKLSGTVTDLINSGGNVVIPDVRFSNELETVLGFGAQILIIQREGVGPDGHKSENIPLYPGAVEIHNNGSKEEMYQQIEELLF